MSNPKMKPEVKEAWLNALRSGEYEQGEGALHKIEEDGPDTFCCLGVLCELAFKAGAVERFETDTYAGANYAYGYDTRYPSDAMPPQEVVDWAFEGPAGAASDTYLAHLGTREVEGDEVYNNVWLPSLNDYKRLSFQSIARVIEMEDI